MLLTAVEYIEGTPTTISETRDKGTLASETRVTAAEIHLTELKKKTIILFMLAKKQSSGINPKGQSF